MKVQPKSQGAHVAAAHHTWCTVHISYADNSKEVYLQIHLFILGCIYYCASVHVCVCIYLCCVHTERVPLSTQNLLRLPRITFFHLTKCLFQLSSPKVNKVLPRNGFGGKWGCFLSPRIGHGRIGHRRIGHAVRSSQYFVGVTF